MVWCGVTSSQASHVQLVFSLSSQAAVAPAAAPRQVPGQRQVVLLLLLTFCAFCTVRPAPRAPAVMIFSRLIIFGSSVLAGLAAARVRPVLVVTMVSALPRLSVE